MPPLRVSQARNCNGKSKSCFAAVIDYSRVVADRQNKSPTGSTPGLGAGAAEGSTSVNRADGRNRGARGSARMARMCRIDGLRSMIDEPIL